MLWLRCREGRVCGCVGWVIQEGFLEEVRWLMAREGGGAKVWRVDPGRARPLEDRDSRCNWRTPG